MKIRLFDYKGFRQFVEGAEIELKGGRDFTNSTIFRNIYKHVGQTINEKSIAVDALSRYNMQILYRSDQ